MKTFTIADIRSFNPCYDPSRHLPEDWTGTALDMLQHPTIPDVDKLWLVLRNAVMSDRGLCLFAVDCARRAQTYPKNYTPDSRTLRAIDVAERFAEGRATKQELGAAKRDAYAAASAIYASIASYSADTERRLQVVYLIKAAKENLANPEKYLQNGGKK